VRSINVLDFKEIFLRLQCSQLKIILVASPFFRHRLLVLSFLVYGVVVGATLSLTCRAMEPGHLFYSALTWQPSGNDQRLKPRHPLVPTAQLIGSSYNNKSAALWADQ